MFAICIAGLQRGTAWRTRCALGNENAGELAIYAKIHSEMPKYIWKNCSEWRIIEKSAQKWRNACIFGYKNIDTKIVCKNIAFARFCVVWKSTLLKFA